MRRREGRLERRGEEGSGAFALTRAPAHGGFGSSCKLDPSRRHSNSTVSHPIILLPLRAHFTL